MQVFLNFNSFLTTRHILDLKVSLDRVSQDLRLIKIALFEVRKIEICKIKFHKSKNLFTFLTPTQN